MRRPSCPAYTRRERDDMLAKRLERRQILTHGRDEDVVLEERVDDDGCLVRPPAIDRGLADSGLSRDALDRELLHRHGAGLASSSSFIVD